MRPIAWIGAAGILALLLGGPVTLQALQEMTGVTLKVNRSADNGGGGQGQSASHALEDSAGEAAGSVETSASFVLYKGLWHLARYPGTITTLVVASSNSASVVNLSWIAPGADGTVGLASKYIVRYSSNGPVGNELGFSTATTFVQSWTPQSASLLEAYALTGLTADGTYYFSVKATTGVSDSVQGYISTGTVFAFCGTPPNKTTDLTGLTASLPGAIQLTWTAPGDDGTTGTATSYAIKMSTTAAFSPAGSDANFAAAQSVSSTSPVPSPLAGGTSVQFMTVTGLMQGVTYYFALKAYDEVGNASLLSVGATAVAQTTILSVSVDSDTYDFGAFAAVQSTISARAIVVTNQGNVAEKYLLRAATVTANSPWSISNARGVDAVAVNALFNGARPSDTNFESVLSTMTLTDQTAGTSGGNFAGDQSGQSVPIAGARNLWFRLGMPLSTSTTAQQSIRVNLTASQ